MREDSWSFRTYRGVAGVQTGALIVRSTPWLFLTGQYTRFREGSSWERVKIGFQVLGLVSLFGRYSQDLVKLYQHGLGVNFRTGMVTVLSVVCAVMIWIAFIRTQRIPLSSIRKVDLDSTEGKLSIDFDRDGKIRQWLGQSDAELELTPRTPEELRKAREILSLRGFSISTRSSTSRPTADSHSISNGDRRPEPTRTME